MTFRGVSGSGSSDPCFWLMDPDPDPAIFVIDLQDNSKKLIFNTIISAYKVHLHHFSKIKSQEESQHRRNQGFSYYFCMMIEGSGAGSGSIPLTSGSGSGSGRPKNMWIRWIRLRIRNTGNTHIFPPPHFMFVVGSGIRDQWYGIRDQWSGMEKNSYPE